MKRKLLIAAQWLAVGVFAVGILYSLFMPVPPRAYQPDSWSSWRGFVALSYAGVTSKASDLYPSHKVLADQLDTLTKAGYQCIRPEDAAAFLRGKTPLPDKAVLLLFQGGRKDSLIRATPVLRRRGLLATMAIPTGTTERWGKFYIKKKDLTKVAQYPEWSLASMGHQTGTDRRLSERLQHEAQPETNTAFAERIENDYRKASHIITTALKARVTAYVYPRGDNGTKPGADPSAAEAHRHAVEHYHDIAFSRSGSPFNDANSDPYALTLLQVNGNWSGTTLLHEIEKHYPREPSPTRVTTDAWDLSGTAHPSTLDQIEFQPHDAAWLRGTTDWSDIFLKVSLNLSSNGIATVYGRYSARQTFIRLTISHAGMRVQEQLAKGIQTLGWYPCDIDTTKPVDVQLQLRGNRVWAWIGETLVADALPLAASTTIGKVGIGCEAGVTSLVQMDAEPLPRLVVLGGDYLSLSADLKKSTTVVIPHWFSNKTPPMVTDSQRENLLTAAACGIETVPMIACPSTLSPEECEQLASSVEHALSHPVYRKLITRVAVTGANEALASSLRDYGYHVVFVGIEQADSILAKKNPIPPSDQIVLTGGASALPTLQRLLRTESAEKLILADAPKGPLPYGVTRGLSADNHAMREEAQ